MSSVIVSSTDLDSFLHQGHGIYHIGNIAHISWASAGK